MNIDMITTFLNDFSTFWSNIWKFLKPIFGMAQNDTWFDPADENTPEDKKAAHLLNLNQLNGFFGGGEYTEVEKPAGSSK